MIDQLTNKEILTIFLSMEESREYIAKGIKSTRAYFAYQIELEEIDDAENKEEKVAKINKAKTIVLDLASKKLSLIEGLVEKFRQQSELIIETDPELYEEVQNIIYDKGKEEEIRSLFE